MRSPALSSKEALLTEIEEFARCIETSAGPATDGASGLRVVEMLAAATRSMAMRGQPVDLGLERRRHDPLPRPRGPVPTIGSELEREVLAAMRSCNYVLGAPVERFEDNFAAYCGTGHAIAVNSGTAALHLALLARGSAQGTR